VDVEGSYLILGKRVTNNPNDKKELVPTVEPVFGTIKETLGFFPKNEILEKFYFNKAYICPQGQIYAKQRRAKPDRLASLGILFD